jgi:Uma2 family endonuclease
MAIQPILSYKFPDAEETPQPRRWTRGEYYRLAEAGILGCDEKVELLDGEIYPTMSPQSRRHARAIALTEEVIGRAFGQGYYVQLQMPILAAEDSEPEPDVAVVKGTWEDYEDHPTGNDVVLVIEIAETSLQKDRILKSPAYARAGIADYWILNLQNRTLEVRRDPAMTEYKTLVVLTEQDTVSPLAAPNSPVQVGALLPPDLRADR